MIRLQPYKLENYANGVMSSVSPNVQPANSVPHSLNFLFDEELGAAVSRKGCTEIGTGTAAYPVDGMHEHRGTNDFALISVSDNTNNDIYKSTGSTWTKSLEDDVKDLSVDFATFLDTCVRVNGTDAVKATIDATTWVTTGGNLDIGNMPNGTILKEYKQRLQVIDESTVYISSTPLSHLSYGTLTQAFTVGAKLEGATSGATAVILADNGSNLLKLGSVSGTFANGEVISDDEDTPGSATSSSVSAYKISWITDNKENLQVAPDNGSDIIAVGTTGGVEGIELFLKDNGIWRYNGSFLDPKPFTSIGCTSKNSVVEFNNGIGFANQEGYYWTNGTATPQILTTPLQDWWDNIPDSYKSKISAYSNDRYLLVSIGDITKKDSFGKSKSYTNVVLRKSLTADNWAVLSYADEFRQFIRYDDSGNKEIWGGTDAGKVLELNNGTSDDGTAIFWEIETPDIIGDSVFSNKAISENLGVYGKRLKGAKVYQSVDNKKWLDSLGAVEEDVSSLAVNKTTGNIHKFKISNSQTGTPITLRGLILEHIESNGTGIPIEERFNTNR